MKSIRLTLLAVSLTLTMMVPAYAQQESMPEIFNATAPHSAALHQKPSAKIAVKKQTHNTTRARRQSMASKGRLVAQRGKKVTTL